MFTIQFYILSVYAQRPLELVQKNPGRFYHLIVSYGYSQKIAYHNTPHVLLCIHMQIERNIWSCQKYTNSFYIFSVTHAPHPAKYTLIISLLEILHFSAYFLYRTKLTRLFHVLKENLAYLLYVQTFMLHNPPAQLNTL